MLRHSIHAALMAAALLLSPLAQAQAASVPGLRPHRPMTPAERAATAPRDPALKPLYAEFGGKAGLVVLMDVLMDNVMADPRTRPYFAGVDRKHVKAELVHQFCVIMDGPCKYTGKSMYRIHRGLDINRAAFNALIENLQTAMDARNIPFRARNKLLAKVAPMYKDVITK